MIIDCHIHLNRYNDDEPAALADRYEIMRDEMERNDINYGIVLSSYAVTDYRPSTDEILEVVKDDPHVGVVAGVSFLHYRAADLAHLRGLLNEKRILGLKLYPGYEPYYVHNPRMRVVYELAAEFQVPVMIHTGDTYDPKGRIKYSHPIEVDEVAVEFPEVTFVICHLGNPWITDAMEVIYKNRNVVGDISGFTVRHFEENFERFMLTQVREVLAYAGDPHSILYGSDWPVAGMGPYRRFVEKLNLTADELQLVLWKNAARIFHIDMAQFGADAE